jgi:HD-like signal output (HDOD) protein
MHSLSPISSASIFPVPSRARLVFVDDDELVLRSFRRLLRGYGQGWDLCFTTDTRRALTTLDSKPVDVLVSDLRMAVGGATVLAEAKASHPDVARILISGDTDFAKILPCIPLAHQLLAKPFDPTHLTGTLERICALRRVVGSTAIRAVVGGSNGLPSAPQTHALLVQALESPQPSAAEIATIVRRDIGVSARLLQLAGSSLFGRTRGVYTIEGAVASLGIEAIRRLVLSSDTMRPLEPRGAIAGFSLSALGEHALRTANLARRIAGRSGDSAFIAGLLHDVGQVVLASRMPHRFAEVIDRARASGAGLLEEEQRILGLTHAEVGAYLLGLWGFKRSTIEAVAHYPNPERSSEPWGLAGIVHVASILATNPDAPLGDEPSGELTHVPAKYLERLGLASELPKWRKFAEEAAP